MRIIIVALLVALIGIAYAEDHPKLHDDEPAIHNDERGKVRCEKYKICQTGKDGRACRVRSVDIRKLKGAQAELIKELSKKLGPNGAKLVAQLLPALAKVPLVGKIMESVSKLIVKTVKDCGTLEQLLSGGALGKAFRGKNLDDKTQKVIYQTLMGIVPSCVACTVTKIIALLVNGALLSKLPIVSKIVPQVAILIPSVVNILKALQKVLKPVQAALTGILGGLKVADLPGKGGLL